MPILRNRMECGPSRCARVYVCLWSGPNVSQESHGCVHSIENEINRTVLGHGHDQLQNLTLNLKDLSRHCFRIFLQTESFSLSQFQEFRKKELDLWDDFEWRYSFSHTFFSISWHRVLNIKSYFEISFSFGIWIFLSRMYSTCWNFFLPYWEVVK